MIRNIEILFDEPLEIFPNPSTTGTTISYILEKPSTVVISMINSQGQKVDELVRKQQKGEQQVHLDTSRHPEGIYFIKLQSEGSLASRKLVVK
jgi:hypothetical protein